MELKDILEYLGVGEVENLDQFKEKFDPEFIRKKNALDNEDIKKTVTGRYFGSQTTNLKKIARENGIELSGEEIEGLQVEDIAGLMLSKVKESSNARINELKESITEPNEALNSLQEKYDKLVNSNKEYKAANKELLNKVEEIQKAKDSEIKNYKLNTFKTSQLGKIKFKQNMSDIEKTGFNTLLDSKYVLDFDEEGKEIITDKEGKRIENPKVTGTFLTPYEVYEKEAIDGGLIAQNPHASNQPAQQVTKTTEPASTNNSGRQAVTKPFFAK